MSAFFALLSAGLVGGADFLGGLASRRMPPLQVAARCQSVGLALSLPVAAATGADRLTRGDVLWALASGLAVGTGLAFFYSAMVLGQLSVVAPTAALVGAVLPVAVGLVQDKRPGVPALIGISAALVAVAIISVAPSGADVTKEIERRTLALAAIAGACFGFFLVCLAQIDNAAGLWAAPLSRVASAGLLVLVIGLMRRGERIPVRRLGGLMVSIGALEIAAVIALVIAFHHGTLAIASVLGSLYPVTTVLLAAFVLHERMSRLQLTAVVLALGAVILISTG